MRLNHLIRYYIRASSPAENEDGRGPDGGPKLRAIAPGGRQCPGSGRPVLYHIPAERGWRRKYADSQSQSQDSPCERVFPCGMLLTSLWFWSQVNPLCPVARSSSEFWL